MRGKTKRQCAKSGEPWEDKNGSLRWFDQDLKMHRDGGPAWIHPDGDEEWYQHGKLHREDGPAKTVVGPAANWIREYMAADPERGYYIRSQKEWWVNGKCQRVLRDDGYEEIHTKDSIEIRDPDGTVAWCDGEGSLHRVGEPAVIHPDGSVKWFYQGRDISLELNERCRMLPQAPWFESAQERMIYFGMLQEIDMAG